MTFDSVLTRLYAVVSRCNPSKTHVHSLWHGIIRLAIAHEILLLEISIDTAFDFSVFFFKNSQPLEPKKWILFLWKQWTWTRFDHSKPRSWAHGCHSICEFRVDDLNPTPVQLNWDDYEYKISVSSKLTMSWLFLVIGWEKITPINNVFFIQLHCI